MLDQTDSYRLWEILIPTEVNCKAVTINQQDGWNYKVMEIANGLTVFPKTKGYWKDKDGQWIIEYMVPVRIACNLNQIEQIADITLKYFNQECVMYYALSEFIEFKYRMATK